MILTDDELLRYSRQILLENWNVDAQLNLKNSRVIVIGAGGLGCPLTETLARAGVGEIVIIDDDVIEHSNLQRQTLFYPEDVGKLKASVACAALQKINQFIKVSHINQRFNEQLAFDLFSLNNETFHLLLDCSDNFATRDIINKVSIKYNIPLLTASAIGLVGQLALFEPDKDSGCYHCLFTGEENDNRSCADSGVLVSTTMIMSNLQAHAALQFLGNKTNILSGKLLIWNGMTMSQKLLSYQKDNTCSSCI